MTTTHKTAPTRSRVAPLWAHNNFTGATRERVGAVLWVVVIAVIPWRHVIRQFVLAPGERWR